MPLASLRVVHTRVYASLPTVLRATFLLSGAGKTVQRGSREPFNLSPRVHGRPEAPFATVSPRTPTRFTVGGQFQSRVIIPVSLLAGSSCSGLSSFFPFHCWPGNPALSRFTVGQLFPMRRIVPVSPKRMVEGGIPGYLPPYHQAPFPACKIALIPALFTHPIQPLSPLYRPVWRMSK